MDGARSYDMEYVRGGNRGKIMEYGIKQIILFINYIQHTLTQSVYIRKHEERRQKRAGI